MMQIVDMPLCRVYYVNRTGYAETFLCDQSDVYQKMVSKPIRIARNLPMAALVVILLAAGLGILCRQVVYGT